METKEQFVAMIKKYLESSEYKEKYARLFKSCRLTSGRGMYSMLYWYTLEFNIPVEFDGEKVDKLLLMPYRIKQEDVDKARNRYVVKMDFIENMNMVTADFKTGNFQKHPDMELQIIFAQRDTGEKGHAGPGKMPEYKKEGDDLDKKYGVVNLDKSYVFKKNWRVPAIGGEDENEEYRLNELMDKAMQILGE